MTIHKRKWISGALAGVCAVLYAAVFGPDLEVAPDGTVVSDGVGRALEMIFVGVIIYGASYFALLRIAGNAKDQG